MSFTIWHADHVVLRQPIFGTGTCIQRCHSIFLCLGAGPFAGSILTAAADVSLDELDYYFGMATMDIRVTSVKLRAKPYKGPRVPPDFSGSGHGSFSCGMILLPTCSHPRYRSEAFVGAATGLGIRRPETVNDRDIVPIDFDTWQHDDYVGGAPSRYWFEGSYGVGGAWDLTDSGQECYLRAEAIWAAAIK